MYKEFINESKGKITVTSFLCIPCKFMRMVISHSFTIILKCKMFLTCRNLWLTSPTTSEHFPRKIPLACTCKRNYLFANLQSILVTDLFCFEFIVTFFNSKKQTKNCNTHCFISFKSHKKCSSSVLLLVNCL